MPNTLRLDPGLIQKGKDVIQRLEKSPLFKNQQKYVRINKRIINNYIDTHKIKRTPEEIDKIIRENHHKREKFNKLIYLKIAKLAEYFKRNTSYNEKVVVYDHLKRTGRCIKASRFVEYNVLGGKLFTEEPFFDANSRVVCAVCGELTTAGCIYFRDKPLCMSCRDALGLTNNGYFQDLGKRGETVNSCGKFHGKYKCRECGTEVVGANIYLCHDRLCAHCAHTRAQRKKEKIRGMVKWYIDEGIPYGWLKIHPDEYRKFPVKTGENGILIPKVFTKKNPGQTSDLKTRLYVNRYDSQIIWNGNCTFTSKVDDGFIKAIKKRYKPINTKIKFKAKNLRRAKDLIPTDEPNPSTVVRVKEYKYPLKFFTLTIKNVKPGQMKAGIKKLRESFKKLKRWKFMQSLVAGYYSIETTYNEENNTYHPHMHILGISDYIPQSKISSAWSIITGDSCVVDVRAIKNFDKQSINKNKSEQSLDNALNEVVKYMVKLELDENDKLPAIFNDELRLMEVIRTLYKSRQFQSFGDWYGLDSAIEKVVDLELELQNRDVNREQFIELILELKKELDIPEDLIEMMLCGIEKFRENEEKLLPECPCCGAHNYSYEGVTHVDNLHAVREKNKTILKHFKGLVTKDKREPSGGCIYE